MYPQTARAVRSATAKNGEIRKWVVYSPCQVTEPTEYLHGYETGKSLKLRNPAGRPKVLDLRRLKHRKTTETRRHRFQRSTDLDLRASNLRWRAYDDYLHYRNEQTIWNLRTSIAFTSTTFPTKPLLLIVGSSLSFCLAKHDCTRQLHA